MSLAAYRGGGRRCTLWCNKSTISEKRILMYFSATLLRLMYILSFYAINALKTQKNGRLLCVPFYGTQYCVPVAQAAHKIRRSGTLSATKAILWLARVTFFLSMCTRSSAPPPHLPFSFLPPADIKNSPTLKM